MTTPRTRGGAGRFVPGPPKSKEEQHVSTLQLELIKAQKSLDRARKARTKTVARKSRPMSRKTKPAKTMKGNNATAIGPSMVGYDATATGSAGVTYDDRAAVLPAPPITLPASALVCYPTLNLGVHFFITQVSDGFAVSRSDRKKDRISWAIIASGLDIASAIGVATSWAHEVRA